MDTKELNAQEKAKFEEISKKPYHEQGKYVLNAFWQEIGSKAEDVWNLWTKMKEHDKLQFNALVTAGKATGDYVEGSSLDEFWSHKFLEGCGKTMSVVDFRVEFKKIDANTDKRMGLVEFMCYEYKLSIREIINRPQGGNPEELAQAQKLLDEVSTAFAAAQTALDLASKTEAQAKAKREAAIKSATEAEAKAKQAKITAEAATATAQESSKKAAEAAAADAEQQAAVAALKKEEDAYNAKTEDLKAKSEAGGVSGMRSKNELAQHLGEDPLPLRKAKITAEAAAKKTAKANEAAAEAKRKADEAAAIAKKDDEESSAAAVKAKADKEAAEAAAEEAERDRVASEERLKEAEAKLAEAEAYLAEVKKKSDKTYGTFWWLDRELAERKKYMPKSGKQTKLLF